MSLVPWFVLRLVNPTLNRADLLPSARSSRRSGTSTTVPSIKSGALLIWLQRPGPVLQSIASGSSAAPRPRNGSVQVDRYHSNLGYFLHILEVSALIPLSKAATGWRAAA